jgi:hypothetical protein
MARRRPTRAERRRAERARENAERRARGQEALEEQPRRLRFARHATQLQLLEANGTIGSEQARAGTRLWRDWHASSPENALKMLNYETGPRSPRKHRPPAPATPVQERAREQFERASELLGELAPVLIHVCICDQPVGAWSPALGASGHGHPVEQLRAGLDALARHYARWSSQGSEGGASRAANQSFSVSPRA